MEEMETLIRIGIRELVSLVEKKLVGCKWVYIVKVKEDGSGPKRESSLILM